MKAFVASFSRKVVCVSMGCMLVLCSLVFSQETTNLPNDVRWVRKSMEYQNLCIQIYRNAGEKMTEYAKGKKERLAVVLDLDETVLDNSPYQVQLWQNKQSFTQESWNIWVNRVEAGLVPGAKNFLSQAERLGMQVVFLSNRMESNLKPTKRNLKALGVLGPKDLFLLRKNKQDTKELRRKEILEGTGRMKTVGMHEVVVYLGDQIGDFPSQQPTKFGDRFFLFPNPTYGKW